MSHEFYEEMIKASKSTYKWKKFRIKLRREQQEIAGRELSFFDALRFKLIRNKKPACR